MITIVVNNIDIFILQYDFIFFIKDIQDLLNFFLHAKTPCFQDPCRICIWFTEGADMSFQYYTYEHSHTLCFSQMKMLMF